ncbi:UNVERIFIED_CONTAM: hypothetical protein Sangu_2466500 [Sesamum angustifolium]|uniref:Uncharacterized protein n=1 Tax=Sesamum angustifolium TaxID=2727405 RepID=A0AAW2J4H5_9LAMI
MDDTNMKEEEADQEEETLSLCDFPLNSGDDPKKRLFQEQPRHHLLRQAPPHRPPPSRRPRILKSLSEHDAADHFSRRYCHYSLPELNPTRPNGVASKRLPRGGRPKFRRRSPSALLVKPEPLDIHRSLSKSSAKSDGSSSKVAPKPRWFVLMFGPLRLQQEMDLQDIKNRQVRRNPGSMFPGMDGGGGIPAGRRSSWGHDLLRVLSCKNHASVAVTASIGLVPHF